MSGYITVTTEVDVDVYLDEIDDYDLIEELKRRDIQRPIRGLDLGADSRDIVREMYNAFNRGDDKALKHEMLALFYNELGRIA